MKDIRDYGLKPCPFCGSTDLSVFSVPYDVLPSSEYLLPPSRMAFFNVKIQCRCGLIFEQTCVSSDEFIKAWNTRGGAHVEADKFF